MKDSDWQILSELYDTKNITRAAEKLYITQPSLTKRLKMIEDEFQIAIVNRTTKGVEFTPEGEFLAEKAKEYQAFMDSVHRDLANLKGGVTQPIILGTSYTFSKYELMDLIFAFNAWNRSKTQFDIRVEQSNLLFRHAVDGALDAAFLRGDYEGSVEQIKVGYYKGYILSKNPVTAAELPGMIKIDYKTNDQTMILLNKWWAEQFGGPMPKGTNVGYLDVACDLLARSDQYYTICFLPEHYENRHNLYMGPMIAADGTRVCRNTWFVFRQRKNMPAQLARFVEYVEKNMRID